MMLCLTFQIKALLPQRIHGQPHHIVNPFLFREAVVAGVVHDVERDAYQRQPEEDMVARIPDQTRYNDAIRRNK